MLEPYALRQHERTVAARGKKDPLRTRRTRVDLSPARVARAYRRRSKANTRASDPSIP